MSLPALEAFAEGVRSDPQLRQKLNAATGLDDVVAIAQAQGHSFSKARSCRATLVRARQPMEKQMAELLNRPQATAI